MTRGYELDRTGRIAVAMIARYMEYLRWEALADAAVGLARLFEGNHHTVVRSQRIAVAEFVTFNVELRASLWVGRVGRTSLDLHHRIDHVSDGREVARGVVTGVFVDPNGRPASIPPEVKALAGTNDQGLSNVARRFSDAAPDGAWSSQIAIRPSDTDMLRHMNHAVYVTLFDDARTLAAADARFSDRPQLASRPVSDIAIEYIEQAVFGDDARVLVWPVAADIDAVDCELRRARDGRTLCRARMRVGG